MACYRGVNGIGLDIALISSSRRSSPLRRIVAVSREEGAHCRPSVAFELGFAGAVIPGEHGLVHRYPQQQSDEVVSRQERIIYSQPLVVGKPLETDCQRSEYPLEALLIPGTGHVRKTAGVGDH